MRGLLALGPALSCLLCCAPGDDAPGAQALPETFGVVEPFSLHERSGRWVTLADLEGSPWIANVMFTRCSGPCPRLAAAFAGLQDRFEGTDVRLVSITVDPEHDTPGVLADYADRFGADADRWWFLTGDEAGVHGLVTGSLKQAFVADEDRPAGMRVTHSTRFVLVDGTGQIRGFFESGDGAAIETLVRRARALSGGPR